MISGWLELVCFHYADLAITTESNFEGSCVKPSGIIISGHLTWLGDYF